MDAPAEGLAVATASLSSTWGQGRLKDRLAEADFVASQMRTQMRGHRHGLAEIAGNRSLRRQQAHQESLESLRQALAPVRAPRDEHRLTVKERLRKLHAAAQCNAEELQERGEILKEGLAARRAYAAGTGDADLEAMRQSRFSAQDSQQHEHFTQLPPITGSAATARMQMAIVEARISLEARGKQQCEVDLSWAERRVEDQQRLAAERPPAAERRPPLALAPNASAPELGASAAGPLAATGALAGSTYRWPTQWQERWSAARRFGHNELHPSISERCRVMEDTLRRNASEMDALKEAQREYRRLD